MADWRRKMGVRGGPGAVPRSSRGTHLANGSQNIPGIDFSATVAVFVAGTLCRLVAYVHAFRVAGAFCVCLVVCTIEGARFARRYLAFARHPRRVTSPDSGMDGRARGSPAGPR